jgi:hypothetical protein
MSKNLLADALRRYPTWGHAYIAAREELIESKRLLLHVEGLLLAMWTDITQEQIQELLPQLRERLGAFEPSDPDSALPPDNTKEPG